MSMFHALETIARRGLVDLAAASKASPVAAVGLAAVGALAVGAVAIGALSIGRASVGQLRIEHLSIGSIDIDRRRKRALGHGKFGRAESG